MADFDPQSPEWHAFRMSVRLQHGHVLEEPYSHTAGRMKSWMSRCGRCHWRFLLANSRGNAGRFVEGWTSPNHRTDCDGNTEDRP